MIGEVEATASDNNTYERQFLAGDGMHLEWGGDMERFENFSKGGGYDDFPSQVGHLDCRKPKNEPLWPEACSFLVRVFLRMR